MLKRKMIEYLVNWKSTKNEECLVVKGARQVGKTYIIREFGKTYKNFIEINFLLNKSAKTAFAGDLLVDDILMSLSANVKDVKFVPKETLRFLYKGIIINHNKKLSQPTLKRRFFKKKAAFFSWPGLGKEWC